MDIFFDELIFCYCLEHSKHIFTESAVDMVLTKSQFAMKAINPDLHLITSGWPHPQPPHLEELRQICQEYYNTMWKVESEKYDEEFELMKKEFEVAYTQTWSYDSTPPSPPTSLESPSPLAIASAEPVSELSAPFWLFRKTWSANTLHALFAFFPLARLSKTLGRYQSIRIHVEEFHFRIFVLNISHMFFYYRNVKKKLCVQRIGVKHPPTGSSWVPLTMSSSFRCIG